MITGYMDEDGNVYCTECRRKTKILGGPRRSLDMMDPSDPFNTALFWVVDRCVLCEAVVNYENIKLLA